ncbi:MAG TPA: response regulator [Clostridia bacterium]|nr:response regulator [Clostridia bacterium]
MQRTALVVEDNPLNMELIEELLLAKGWTVLKAYDVEEARQVVAAGLPDLIFLDIQLPGQDGLSYAAQLRMEYGAKVPPLIAITAQAMKGDGDKILAAGFDYYLPKPFEFAQFYRIIDEALNSR